MKKIALYTVSILLLTIVLVGGTYAYLLADASTSNSAINEKASNFQVIYSGGDPINGPINIISGEDQSKKIKTSVKIKMSADSVDANAQLFINVEEITQNLVDNEGLKWEIYGYIDGTLEYSNKGTFKGVDPTNATNCSSSGNKITCKEGYYIPIIGMDTKVPLIVSQDEITFDIYFWLDGNIVANEILGASFKGTIGAKTEAFTANLQ